MLLKDEEIKALITGSQLVIDGFDTPSDWNAAKSPAQASSLDLHIGEIHEPSETKDSAVSQLSPLKGHCLEPGGTAVVFTKEKLKIPKNLGGIVFPESSVSFKGILVTNPGHVDPGYEGRLRFTIINMGRKSYPLLAGEAIVTLLLFRMNGESVADYLSRHNNVAADGPKPEDINLLTKDFLQVQDRATEVAKKAITNAGFLASIGAVSIAGLLSWLAASEEHKWETPYFALEEKVLRMETNSWTTAATNVDNLRSNLTSTVTNVDNLRIAISNLQNKIDGLLKSNVSTPPPANTLTNH